MSTPPKVFSECTVTPTTLGALHERMAREPQSVTPAEKYAPCSMIAEDDWAQAHLLACVRHLQALRPDLSFAQALSMERAKIGYYAGYLEPEGRMRVERVFGCVHPFAGAYRGGVRKTQLGGEFEVLVDAWDKQPPGSRAFGMHRQPRWDEGLLAKSARFIALMG